MIDQAKTPEQAQKIREALRKQFPEFIPCDEQNWPHHALKAIGRRR